MFAGPLGVQGGLCDVEAGLKDMLRPVDSLATGDMVLLGLLESIVLIVGLLAAARGKQRRSGAQGTGLGLKSGWLSAPGWVGGTDPLCGQGGEKPRLLDPRRLPGGMRGGVCCPGGCSKKN